MASILIKLFLFQYEPRLALFYQFVSGIVGEVKRRRMTESISHAELHGSSQSKTEIEESQKKESKNEAQESSSEEEELIDLTKKIKVEDVKINTGKYMKGFKKLISKFFIGFQKFLQNSDN